MAFPEPRLGLVVCYSYLWHREQRAGREEGAKNRPCVIVLAARRQDDGTDLVRVVPVTHSPPEDPAVAMELPAAVKRHLGLDAARSWVMLDELNEFIWPGFDLRPIPGTPGRCDYGFLPPRLFGQMVTQLRAVWRGKAATRG